MVEDFWDRSARWLVWLSIPVGLFSALGILGWQTLKWLRTGGWVPIPLSKAFEYFGVDLTPIYNPTDWDGLAKIGQWVLELPLSACIPVVTIGAALAWKALVSSN